MSELPSGTVTFLFTDIEGSTRLLQELGEAYAEALAEHRRVLREAFERYGGAEVDTQGDAFFVAFGRASDAVAAAGEAQARLEGGSVQVRMGLHTGEPLATAEGYVGIDVHRAARIAAAGHGGQVLLSQTTVDLVEAEVRDLGEHRLKDLSAPERIFQLGERDFPRLKTLHQTNLPIQPTPLIGRERELSEIASFSRSGSRLVTLTGPGGSGKTKLALHAAAELVDDFPDGVWFVPLAPVTDPELVEPAIAQALDLRGEVESRLRSKRALLVLDNMEQLLAAAPRVGELLALAPGLRVIATSRERLALTAEQEYDVAPLPFDDGVTLFVECACRLVPTFEPDEHVPAIVRRLDGLPLALELAAAWTKLLSPAQIGERLGGSLDLLVGGARDLPERQRTLRATIEWSYDLLSEDERRTFARLAVFAGTFGLDAAEEVVGASLEALSALVDKSLLSSTGEGRFFLLETIREFAAERLAALGKDDELRERELAYLLRVLEPRAVQTREEGVRRRMLFALEQDNVRASLGWLLGQGRHGDALALLRPCTPLWMARGNAREVSRWCDAALVGGRGEPAVRAEVLAWASYAAWVSGNNERAGEVIEEALTLLRSVADPELLAFALMRAGEVYSAQDPVRARALFEASLESAPAGSERRISTLHNYGEFELLAGNVERAAVLLEESLVAARAGTSTADEPLSLSGLGDAALLTGDASSAAARYREALIVSREFGAPVSFPFCLSGLAATAAIAGDTGRASILWGAAQGLEERYGPILPQERPRHEQFLHSLDAALVECGRALTEDEALAYALSVD